MRESHESFKDKQKLICQYTRLTEPNGTSNKDYHISREDLWRRCCGNVIYVQLFTKYTLQIYEFN